MAFGLNLVIYFVQSLFFSIPKSDSFHLDETRRPFQNQVCIIFHLSLVHNIKVDIYRPYKNFNNKVHDENNILESNLHIIIGTYINLYMYIVFFFGNISVNNLNMKTRFIFSDCFLLKDWQKKSICVFRSKQKKPAGPSLHFIFFVFTLYKCFQSWDRETIQTLFLKVHLLFLSLCIQNIYIVEQHLRFKSHTHTTRKNISSCA